MVAMTVNYLNQSLSMRPCEGVTEPYQGRVHDLMRQIKEIDDDEASALCDQLMSEDSIDVPAAIRAMEAVIARLQS